MHDTKIKICGIRSPDMAQYALKHGATYIGLVFHTPSSRCIKDLATAKFIALKTKFNGGKTVGVFVDQTADEINAICRFADINIVQLHGETSKNDMAQLDDHLVKIFVINVDSDGNYQLPENIDDLLNSEKDFLLFDTDTPGTGQSFSHNTFSYQGPFNYFVAGGLSPDNVKQCINKTTPFAVDVSSGVECLPGSKNKQLINQFIECARHVEYS